MIKPLILGVLEINSNRDFYEILHIVQLLSLGMLTGICLLIRTHDFSQTQLTVLALTDWAVLGILLKVMLRSTVKSK